MNKLDKDYINLIEQILKDGNWKEGRNGRTISLFGAQIRHKMSEGFPLLTTKKLSFKNIFEELMWFLRGETNIKSLVERGCNIWNGDCYKRYKTAMYIKWEQGGDIADEIQFVNLIKTDDDFAKEWGELGPTYGHQWRNWGSSWNINSKTFISSKKIDQIQNILNTLKTNPDDRRMLVSAWNVSEVNDTVLPPCHPFFQFYTRKLTGKERYNLLSENEKKYFLIGERPMASPEDNYDRLEYTLDFYKHIPKRAISLQFNMRSVDVPLGMPYNIASYGLLLSLIAKYMNMVPDELIGIFGDTHIYENQIEKLKTQLDREPYQLPTLEISEIETSDISEYKYKSLNLINYISHPSINIPLSN